MNASNRSAFVWFCLSVITLGLYQFPETFSHFVFYPESWVFSITDILNAMMDWFVDVFGSTFKAVGWLLEWPVRFAQALLAMLPWSVTTAIITTLAWMASGSRLALFSLLSLLYMLVLGYWSESMNSLSIVLISVPMAIAVGFGLGVFGFYSKTAKRVIMPMLDLFQTVPAFAYLLPILILFGFGTTAGLVSSVLYAFPPMVRNTILGLSAVPSSIIEAGLTSGATGKQLFWKVRLPSAQNQLLLGVNQTIMASLSMVIIASIIGGTNDIGWEVLSTIRKAQFGESLLAGFVIVLMAMILDRVSYGFATRDTFELEQKQSLKVWHIGGISALVLAVLSLVVPFFDAWPETLVFSPAAAMNDVLESLVVNWRGAIENIKNWAFFFVMLPVKIGFAKAVSPYTWGFTLTPAITTAYSVMIVSFATIALFRGKANMAAGILLFGVMLYIGLTNMPWLALLGLVVWGAWSTGGISLAISTALSLGFLLVAGIWEQAVLSLYLCAVSVLVSFSIGATIGIWSSQNNTVATVVRPIIDTLQTIPLFVILIPFVMVFKIGEFTALLAIVAYSIVPAIRYTDHGLRNLPSDVIEAANAIGCTQRQLLFRVKLPLALPAIMLGLNQTIIYGIGMLVIAALVGTNGLGQLIYIGLGNGDFGVGITAGLGMAMIAIIADRITQAISKKKQEKFGLMATAL
jgi:glycine betaine/proline transport system permease protein